MREHFTHDHNFALQCNWLHYHPPMKLRESNVFMHVCLSRGTHVTISYDAFGLTVQGTPPSPAEVPSDMGPQAPHLHPGSPASDIWWPPLETCSNLFTSGSTPTVHWADISLGRQPLGRHPPGSTPPDGHCSGWYASYRNAFLFHTVFSENYSEYLALHKLNSLILYYVYLLVRDCNPVGPTFLFFSHDY